MDKRDFFKLPDGSGTFKLKPKKHCLHPDHNFPSHMCIPSGHGCRHICPSCGEVKVVTNPPSFNA